MKSVRHASVAEELCHVHIPTVPLRCLLFLFLIHMTISFQHISNPTCLQTEHFPSACRASLCRIPAQSICPLYPIRICESGTPPFLLVASPSSMPNDHLLFSYMYSFMMTTTLDHIGDNNPQLAANLLLI